MKKLSINNEKIITHCLLLFLFFNLISCELISAPREDLFLAISNEVDWAKVPKLSVRMDFPSAWGTSNPPQGSITPAMDIRKGYEFSVEFTPDTAYTLKKWRVFPTAELDELGNWLENLYLIDEKVEAKELHPLVEPDEVTISANNPAGGTFKFTIHTTEPVTLIPWCDTSPRIINNDPYDSVEPFPRATGIMLYFNCALDANTVRFAENETDNGIWITAKTGSAVTYNQDENWYSEPEYAASGGFFTVTVNSGANLPPANSLMTVTVKGIANTQAEEMVGTFTFSWKTPSDTDVNVDLTEYKAKYNYNESTNSGSINVSWTATTGANVDTYYRINRGVKKDLISATIPGVDGPGYYGVREGRQASGINEYEIIIELSVENIMERRVTFKIWNIPGMEVSKDNPLAEVRTAAELAAMKDNLSGQYVLANDINIPGDWMPIGKFDNDRPELTFTGKFYGNGHTVTLSRGFNGELCYGLFGCAQNAVIRDFTLEYKNSSPISPNFSSFSAEIKGQAVTGEAIIIGSVAGLLIKTEVCNIITSDGTFAIEVPYASADVNKVILGGIAGLIEGEGRIENCRAALSVKYTSKGHTGKVNMGAVAGMSSKALLSIPVPEGSGLILNEVTVAADVSADKRSYSGIINIGGAFGKSEQNTLNDITFTAGKTVSFSRSSNSNDVCGGIAGSIARTNMAGCLFLGTIDITGATVSVGYPDNESGIWIGGLVGKNDDGNAPPKDSGDVFDTIRGDYYFQNCLVRGDIKFKGVSIGQLTVGGIFGSSNKYGGDKTSMNIKDCFFDGGNITIGDKDKKVTAPLFNVGGFIGGMEGGGLAHHNINNCGALQGQISINAYGAVEVGGFTSQFSGTISNCFSRIDINVESEHSGRCNVGGFIGTLDTGDSKINNCYATGNVSVVTQSTSDAIRNDQPAVGGLVGRADGIIKDSYALGNVMLSDSGYLGPASAGGLVGYNWDGNINNCFSKGQVSVESDTNPQVYSGGIVGYNKNGAITNTAAFGASITAGGNVKAAGRIYGYSTNVLAVSAKNYALKTMSVEESEYDSTVLTSVILDKGLNAKDGQDTPSSTFLSQSFWNTTLDFVSGWDFSRVARDGYPRLLNVGGQ